MVELIVTDFDGTLVDTFEANYRAYAEAFAASGLKLEREAYRECYGCRFDDFMQRMGVASEAVRRAVREAKRTAYPRHFGLLRANAPLASLLRAHKASGGLTAIASTARRENLLAALEAVGLTEVFDLVLTGSDTLRPKPAPDIYLEAMRRLGAAPAGTLVFEDTDMGVAAAEAAGASVVKVTPSYFTGNDTH